MLKKIIRKIYIAYLKFIQHRWEGYKYRKKANLPDIDILPANSFYFLGLVAIFRGEDDYLVEWIEFHKMMGIEHFILYDNGLEKSSQALLKPYIEKGLVTHIPFPDVPGLRDGRYANTLSIQQMAYADFIIRFRSHFKFIIQLDIDEFLFPKSHNSITDALKQFDDLKLARIEVNWTNFGNSNHIRRPKGLVLENYTMADIEPNKYSIKSISNTSYLSMMFKFSNVHFFQTRYSLKDFITKLFKDYPKIISGDKANIIFQLNHYITKSKEEYLRKFKINKGGYMTGEETEENFIRINSQINQVEDKTIHRFLPELKKILNNDS
ncbi:glycosyltransferase family 92 protein [Candidatus Neomarinimicrobiota bacterium]